MFVVIIDLSTFSKKNSLAVRLSFLLFPHHDFENREPRSDGRKSLFLDETAPYL